MAKNKEQGEAKEERRRRRARRGETLRGYAPRLRKQYEDDVVPKLKKEFGIENGMAVPRLEKIVINMGLGEAIQNIKILDDGVDRARGDRRPASFGPPLAQVDRAVQAARGHADRLQRDAARRPGCGSSWTGSSASPCLASATSGACRRKSFDGRGNYTMGIRDHLIFQEIDMNKVERPKGMNITFVTTAENDEQALHLLRGLGVPLR